MSHHHALHGNGTGCSKGLGKAAGVHAGLGCIQNHHPNNHHHPVCLPCSEVQIKPSSCPTIIIHTIHGRQGVRGGGWVWGLTTMQAEGEGSRWWWVGALMAHRQAGWVVAPGQRPHAESRQCPQAQTHQNGEPHKHHPPITVYHHPPPTALPATTTTTTFTTPSHTHTLTKGNIITTQPHTQCSQITSVATTNQYLGCWGTQAGKGTVSNCKVGVRQKGITR